MPQTIPVRYRVDAGNRIIAVNDAWDRFAEANDGHHLLGAAVVGMPLFNYITDPTTRLLYTTMLDRVRGRRMPLLIHFRCDAPSVRREMTLEMRAEADSAVEFVVQTQREDTREAVSLLDANASRDGRIVRMCGWCKRVQLPSHVWIEVEEAIGPLEIFAAATVPMLSHGICERCEADALVTLDGLLPSATA